MSETLSTTPPVTPEAPRAKARRKPPVMAIAGVLVALAVGAAGFQWWRTQNDFVSTNDAQVKGDIIAVSPKISGRLARVLKHTGDTVRTGELVAELDAAEIRIQLQQAEANLAAARAGLEGARTTVALTAQQTLAQERQAQAGFQSALEHVRSARVGRDKAAADLARLEPLAAEGGLSRQQLESARAALATAEAQLMALQAQARNAQAGIALAESGETQVRIREQAVATGRAQIAQAEAAVAAARQQLVNTRLLSPLTGRVAQVSRLAGENLQPGQPVLSVVAADGLYVNAYVEETKIRAVHGGQPVDVDIDAFPGRVFKGHVHDIGAAAGSEFALIPQNNASGNFTKVVQRLPVRILVEDPEQVLKPGMSATVKIAVRGT